MGLAVVLCCIMEWGMLLTCWLEWILYIWMFRNLLVKRLYLRLYLSMRYCMVV